MRNLALPAFAAAFAASFLAPLPSRAADPPNGTLRAITKSAEGPSYEVSLDRAGPSIRVRACTDAACAQAEPKAEIRIPIDRQRIDEKKSFVEVLHVGDGRNVVHTRVVDVERSDLAFETVLFGSETVYSGMTGYTRGSEGDRSGDVVIVVDRDQPNAFVVVAEAREDTRICGQAVTPLGARALDPKTMQLRNATLHRLDKRDRDAAKRIVAEPATSTTPPLARVLAATGGSAPQTAALTDGDPASTWSERRSGDGHGEFATMRTSSELPLVTLEVTIAPPKPPVRGAAPRTLYIATDKQLFFVTMPEDGWRKPGKRYRIPLPAPVKTTCVAIVLDEAYAGTNPAPDVSIAEVSAFTSFDSEGASLDDVVRALEGARGDEAAALLRRAGDEGFAAVMNRFAGLDERARAFAIDIAASTGTCVGPGAEILTRALSDKNVEVRRRSLGRLERCGKAAAPALANAVASDDEARRAAAAPLLASVAPSSALEPLASQLGKGSIETRRAVRSALARASLASSRDHLLAILEKKEMSTDARVDLLRALGPKLGGLRPDSAAALAQSLRDAKDMPTRYRLVQPLAQLARSEDATQGELSRLATIARSDSEWAVRARAIELSAGIAALASTVAEAAADPHPRVREAALRAMTSTTSSAGSAAAIRALDDEWSFVRVVAAEALGAATTDGAASALGGALADSSPKVRTAALGAIGKPQYASQADRVRKRLDDEREELDIRALAARTLGSMCVRSALDRLTELSSKAERPTSESDDVLGMAAIEALGAIHPADLAKRLAPLRDASIRPPVRAAAERALARPGSCH